FFWHERWTWRDRSSDSRNRFRRLVRFHLTNGAMSLVGNVVVTTLLVGLLGMNLLVANLTAVVLLSMVNYFAADRWVFAERVAIGVAVLFMVSTSHATAAELTPEAIAAWNRHVARVEASLR